MSASIPDFIYKRYTKGVHSFKVESKGEQLGYNAAHDLIICPVEKLNEIVDALAGVDYLLSASIRKERREPMHTLLCYVNPSTGEPYDDDTQVEMNEGRVYYEYYIDLKD